MSKETAEGIKGRLDKELIDDIGSASAISKRPLIDKNWAIAIMVLITIIAIIVVILLASNDTNHPPSFLEAPYKIVTPIDTYYAQAYQIDNGILVIQFPSVGTPATEDLKIIGGNFEIEARTLK